MLDEKTDANPSIFLQISDENALIPRFEELQKLYTPISGIFCRQLEERILHPSVYFAAKKDLTRL
jgi:hypothetical protein